MSRYACTYFCGLMLTEVDVELPLQLPVGVALGVKSYHKPHPVHCFNSIAILPTYMTEVKPESNRLLHIR